MSTPHSKEDIKKSIRSNYGNIALQGAQGCGSCCNVASPQESNKPKIGRISFNLGYSTSDLADMPKNANMGLGCGNPIIIAKLKEGETVLDLGSGGGFDCFLARKQVGETGYVIGVDMTPEMIQLSNNNLKQIGYKNVEFRLGEIEELPIENDSIDVIISNCVINLSQEKEKVFKEAYRVLKPGGRLSISDVMSTAELPEIIKQDLTMISGCIAGAEYTQTIYELLVKEGFMNISLTPKDNSKEILKNWIPGKNIADFITSYIIEAQKQ